MKRLSIVAQLMHFALRVLAAFFRNRGILLAGGVGYNVLLSAVPLFTLLGVLLTHIVEEKRLLDILAIQASHLAPAHANVLLDAVRALLDSRDVLGVVGFVMLLFFSSFAFRMLEDSITLIFRHSHDPVKRRFWVSALLPYAFMGVLGTGLLALTIAVAIVNAFNDLLMLVFGIELYSDRVSRLMLNLFSFLGMFGLFSGIYKVMPTVRIAPKRALIGGFVAAALWELVRLILVYYFVNVSFVNAVYGSLATIIIVLISLEVGAVILLLGAQVIAELERSAKAGLPWHTAPEQ